MMTPKEISATAFTDAEPYDWDDNTWDVYAWLVCNGMVKHPNIPEYLQERCNMRKN